MSFPDMLPSLKSAMPDLRGRLLGNEPLAPLTWFRVGGPAQVLFTPADEDDLAYFLGKLPHDVPVYPIGVGSNLIVRDGGMPGVVIRLSAARFRRDHGDGRYGARRGGRARPARRGGRRGGEHRRPRILFRHSGLDRRRAAHERRRQRRRNQGRAGRGCRRRAQRRKAGVLQRRHEIRLPQQRRGRRRDLHLGALSGQHRRSDTIRARMDEVRPIARPRSRSARRPAARRSRIRRGRAPGS